MRPPLIETVFVQEAPIEPQPQRIQANLISAVGFWNPTPPNGNVFPVQGKAVQVEVAPVHGDLEDVVQVRQRAIATKEHPPPDQRTNPFQIPAQLINLYSLGHIA